jgi:hypothetical protein
MRINQIQCSRVFHDEPDIQGTHANQIKDGMWEHKTNIGLHGGNDTIVLSLKVQMGIEINC